ncbi:MAG: T9SS type A sorting domain-containing protein [Flavobacteriales bacterium]|nr:MAG: T9SS type A sorting domain-containing protein [Flavobacteriales bacterium]
MRCISVVLAGVCSVSVAHAQTHWQGIGLPGNFAEVLQVYTDTTNDALYFCGVGTAIPYNGFSGNPLFKMQNGQWDTLAVFGNQLNAVIVWHDTLIVGGGFPYVNGSSIENIAAYDGQTWLGYGLLPWLGGGVTKFKVLDDELYAIGTFDYIDGHLCNGIAKRVGGQWVSVGPIITTSSHNVADLTMYNGQLVACGGISFSGNPYRNIVIQNPDSSWSPVGPEGLIGNFSYGRCVTVYQGDLYVGGSIPVLAGNAGHGIMRWDGNQWHAVGGGLTYSPNNYSILTGAIDFLERDGLLFVAGSFNYANGDLPATGVATWDGSQWCGLGGTLDGPVNSIAFYHDTLYAACFHNADGIDVNCAAKFIGSNYADTCGVPVGLAEQPETNNQILLWPNPASEFVTVSGPVGNGRMDVFDGTGRLVLSWPYASGWSGPVKGLQPGIYELVLRLEGQAAMRRQRLLVQE